MSGDYSELPELSQVYLEDSYVLGIGESPEGVSFDLEVVLTEHHPLYEPPPADKQYSYRRARLLFHPVRQITWKKRTMRPTRDPDGSVDYGNIESFRFEGDTYRLEGEWGEVAITSEPPQLQFSK